MKATRFLYRVTIVNSQGKTGTFVGEVVSSHDETARRKIVAIELKNGNRVKSITATTDRVKRPGEWIKRSYKD
jgi:hypothetical protein